MKIKALCLIIFTLLFSCELNNWADTIIKNNSDFPVTFKFDNTEQLSLSIGTQTTFPTKAYQRLKSYSPDKRVYFTYSSTNDGYTGEFNTRQSWTVKVINSLGQTVTLSADDWMDSIDDIPTGDQSNEPDYQGKVYTENPIFTVVTSSGFPAAAVYERDSETEDFLVTIQWSK
jgi:hypothetical protein